MANELSEQIAALRKERGLTQEQLGNLVGVSAQAVSKWEKGGTPDVELLPILSRQLGVTIDALFGMEGGEPEDPAEAVGRWLRGFPAKERLDRFCRLVWEAKVHFTPGDCELLLPDTGYPGSCEFAYGDEMVELQLSQIVAEGGFLFDVHAEDLTFVTLWPRPQGGWARWLAPKEDYRQLFSVLAKPGCLELVEFIYRWKTAWFSTSAVTKHLDMARENVEALLEDLAEVRMLTSMELELEDGATTVYKVVEPWKLIPFLMLARTMMQYDSNFFRLGDATPLMGPEEVWAETRNGNVNDRKERSK